jgi:hypothetical protein
MAEFDATRFRKKCVDRSARTWPSRQKVSSLSGSLSLVAAINVDRNSPMSLESTTVAQFELKGDLPGCIQTMGMGRSRVKPASSPYRLRGWLAGDPLLVNLSMGSSLGCGNQIENGSDNC